MKKKVLKKFVKTQDKDLEFERKINKVEIDFLHEEVVIDYLPDEVIVDGYEETVSVQ